MVRPVRKPYVRPHVLVLSVTDVMPEFADQIAIFLHVRVEAAEGLYSPLDHVVPGVLRARVNYVLVCCTLPAVVQELVV